jgi:heme A synthase
MKKTLLGLALFSTVILAACNIQAPSTGSGTVVDSGAVVEETPITMINIYQVQLEGTTGTATGTTAPLGCNDLLVELPVEVDMTEVNKYPKTWDAIVDYDFEDMGLVNPWKTQDAVEFDSYEIVGNTLTVNLSGSIKIGGVCDVPRLNETVKATYKNFGYDDVVVLVNGQTIN